MLVNFSRELEFCCEELSLLIVITYLLFDEKSGSATTTKIQYLTIIIYEQNNV